MERVAAGEDNMNRFALVITDTHLVPGSHALLSALEYYGASEVDVHYLAWPGSPAADAVVAGEYSWYPNFYHIPLVPDILPPEYAPLWDNAPNCCYHSRFAYAANLKEYEAVSIFDADILLCNNPIPYFELAATSGKFLTPDNEYSGYQADGYDLAGIQGDASPPWHNQPSFFCPATWGSFMRRIPLVGMAEKRSDIVALSRMLLQEGRADDVLTLPACLWLSTHYYRQHLVLRNVGDKRYLALHENGDRLNAVHRRWWMSSICTQFLTDITPGEDRERGRNNIRLFHDMYTFFNRDCTHRLEYDYEWVAPTD